MNTILTIKDIKLIIQFYQKLNILNEDIIKNIMDNIGNSKIIAAHVEANEITSLIIVNLINNIYYLERFQYLIFNSNEISSLLTFLTDKLTEDTNSISVIYDNYPFSIEEDKIFLSSGFNYSFINYINNANNEKIEEFKTEFRINDKSEDVVDYLTNKYAMTSSKMNKYLNLPDKEIKDKVNLDNTNIVVIRDTLNKVIGVSVFGIVNEYMFINSIYAEDENTYLELLKIIKSLTSRVLQIGVMPVRKDLIDILNRNDYIICQADYLKDLKR